MASSKDDIIKSGPEIVSDFLDGLEAGEFLDADTVGCIRDLQQTANLTRTRLLQALEQVRATTLKKV